MGHQERCYHTTAPVALALGGIRRMENCLGAAIDRQFVAALIARLPTIAEQGRARSTRPRGLLVYAGALEHGPVRGAGSGESSIGRRARLDPVPLRPRSCFILRL